jgi:hypothetical protein
MDSHVDQCCVGDNAFIFTIWPGQVVQVAPFLNRLGSVADAPIVTAGIMYDDHKVGQPILLILHQAILIKGMKHNLLCPMQIRHNGVTVNDRLKHCTPIPTNEDHPIIIPDGNYMIPLDLKGVTLYFPSRMPTGEEAARFKVDGDNLELTADSPMWEPNSHIFQEVRRWVWRANRPQWKESKADINFLYYQEP